MLTIFLALALSADKPMTTDQLCSHMGEVAEAIMRKRQAEEPLSKVLALFDNDPAKELMRSIVLDAYDRPAYSSPEYRQREAASFRNYWEGLCYKSQAGKR